MRRTRNVQFIFVTNVHCLSVIVSQHTFPVATSASRPVAVTISKYFLLKVLPFVLSWSLLDASADADHYVLSASFFCTFMSFRLKRGRFFVSLSAQSPLTDIYIYVLLTSLTTTPNTRQLLHAKKKQSVAKNLHFVFSIKLKVLFTCFQVLFQ